MNRDALYRRWERPWRILALAAFTVVGAAAVSSAPTVWNGFLRFWATYGAFVIWYVLSIPIGRDRLYNSLPFSLLYFAVGWMLWILLLGFYHLTYAFFVVLFPLTYLSLPLARAIFFSLVLTALMYGAQSGWSFEPSLEGGFGIASMVMVSLFIDSVLKRSEEREKLIEQLETARAHATRAEREAGILQERQRLAQGIHDTVAQAYVGIVTHLEAAEAAAQHEPGIAAHLAAAKESARTSLTETRRLTWNLRPDLTNGEALPVVLTRLVDGWGAATGVSVHWVVTGNPEQLGPELEATLVQGAREALNNVRVHACAAQVTITLSYMEDEVVLDVQDDGRGIDPAALTFRGSEKGGFGLRALTQRARALGGRASLETTPGSGTTVTISLPIR